MLTLFSVPKAFRSPFVTIQHNAITSWVHIRPKCQVILFGNEEGVAEAAAQHGVDHVRDVPCNRHGTPLLNAVFDAAQELARYPIVGYANADIIFMDLPRAVQRINLPSFLLLGRRLDMDIPDSLNMDTPQWERDLRERAARWGVLHGHSAIDYLAFPRGQVDMLPFPVGRKLWDNWLVFRSRCLGIPVIDGTGQILAIHQNHDYSHYPGGRTAVETGPEVQRNWEMVGPDFYPFDIRDAGWILGENGLRPSSGLGYAWRRLVTIPALYPPLRPLVRIGRKLKHAYTAPLWR